MSLPAQTAVPMPSLGTAATASNPTCFQAQHALILWQSVQAMLRRIGAYFRWEFDALAAAD
jgi:hypothetical protein